MCRVGALAVGGAYDTGLMPNTAPTGYPTLIGFPNASVTPVFPPRLVTLFFKPSMRISLRQLKVPRS